MQPNDVFERDYVATVTRLEAKLQGLARVARIDTELTRNFWRGRIDPHAVNACRLELIVYRSQHYDITIGPETYEGRMVQSLGTFEGLLDAISSGHVITRRWRSATTGALIRVETRVSMADGSVWQDSHEHCPSSSDALEMRDHHYVAYARAH
jgi:hypothetical protein